MTEHLLPRNENREGYEMTLSDMIQRAAGIDHKILFVLSLILSVLLDIRDGRNKNEGQHGEASGVGQNQKGS